MLLGEPGMDFPGEDGGAGLGAGVHVTGEEVEDGIARWAVFSFGIEKEAGEGLAILAAEPHEFVRGYIEHVLRDALCRELEIYDMPVVEELKHQIMADSGKQKSLLVAITTSYPFRHLRDADLRQ
ncbi:MAG: DUF1585 domain-containing protein [Akkermansiaceae bacterium]|jgi:hypothetical protein